MAPTDGQVLKGDGGQKHPEVVGKDTKSMSHHPLDTQQQLLKVCVPLVTCSQLMQYGAIWSEAESRNTTLQHLLQRVVSPSFLGNK